MVEILLIITLAGVIVGLFVERHITLVKLLEKVDNSFKAIMSKNANEYSLLIKEPLKEEEQVLKAPDDVPVDQLTDEEFSKFIKKQANS